LSLDEEKAKPSKLGFGLPVQGRRFVALIRKKVSSALVAANRANSRKSTGPQTELGKRHSSQNAGKHLVYARVFSPSMKELGENPADFDKLRDSLGRAFAPRDGFEQMLVEDMAG
jgi:hypothetical protein